MAALKIRSILWIWWDLPMYDASHRMQPHDHENYTHTDMYALTVALALLPIDWTVLEARSMLLHRDSIGLFY